VTPVVGSRLARMIAIVNERLIFQEKLRELRQMRQWILEAEHILSADFVQEGVTVSNATVGHQFDAWRQELARQLTEGVLSCLQQECLQQFLQVLSNQRSHLIQCYDRQSFPRTNNEMERRIRGLKTRYRRISGRKNWNSYLLRYGRCVAYYDWWEQDAERSHQFLQHAAQLDRASWRKNRREARAATSEQLKRFRFRRKRHAYLASLEVRWAAVAPTPLLL
jgi:Transposase IS66 family